MNLENFVTWDALTTYGGCLAMVALLTQLTKGWLPNLPTQILSYVLAIAVLLPALYFTGALTAGSAVLAFFNAAIISLAANGAYTAVQRATTPKEDKTDG